MRRIPLAPALLAASLAAPSGALELDRILVEPPGWYSNGFVYGVGDIDDDGLVDLAVPVETDFVLSMALYFSDGDANGDHVLSDDIEIRVRGLELGDITGDGIDDLGRVVLGHGYGYVEAYAGSSQGELQHLGQVWSPDELDAFGSAVDAFDWNGDGSPDLVVGAPWGDPSEEVPSGRVYVYFGDGNVGGAPDLVLAGEPGRLGFGACVARAGDIDGDGYEDLAVGSYRTSRTIPLPGRVQIFFGGPELDDVADRLVEGEGPGDLFGLGIVALGDIDGDGDDDLAASAAYFDGNGEDSGRVYVLFGPALDRSQALTIDGSEAHDALGLALAAGHSVDGDAYPDLAIAARVGRDETRAGLVQIHRGGPGFDAVTDDQLELGEPEDRFGASLEMVEDTTGDGAPDLLVGALGTRIEYVYAGGDASVPAVQFALNATADARSVHLRWSLEHAGAVEALRLSRRDEDASVSTPLAHWSGASLPTQGEYVDELPASGSRFEYRLDAILPGGERIQRSVAIQATDAQLRTALLDAWPNPFAPDTRIQFRLAQRGPASLLISDARGRRVRELSTRELPPGLHSLLWDGRDDSGSPVARGHYTVLLRAGGTRDALRLVRIR